MAGSPAITKPACYSPTAVVGFLRRKSLSAGSKIKMIAMIVIGPATGRLKKIIGSPDYKSSDWRKVGSAMGPSTMASTAGAKG